MGDTRCFEDFPVLPRQLEEEKEVEVKYLVKARDVTKGVVLPLVWENLDVMAYVNSGAKYFDATMLGALCSHGRATKIIHGEGSV